MSASEIVPGLWVGNHPPEHEGLGALGFRHLVLAAAEIQPAADLFKDVDVLHAPLNDDHVVMSDEEKIHAISAGSQVAQWLRAKEPTVVTCHEGHNRSGLIAALALMFAYDKSPEEAINLIRAARGQTALTNPNFLKLLEDVWTIAQVPVISAS